MDTKLVDYHIHTSEPFEDQKEPHAKGSWQDYFDAAPKNIIPGNANHAPHIFGKNKKNIYPYERDGNIRGVKLWTNFLKKNLDFRDKNKEALLGLEVDFFEDVPTKKLLEAIETGYLSATEKHLKTRLKEKPFDYIILSCHFIYGRPFDYDKKEYLELKKENNATTEKLIQKYWDTILQMTKLGDTILKKTKIKKVIIGHIDLIKIISLFEKEKLEFYAPYEKTINQILENIKKFNLTLEYNTAGIRKGVGNFPDQQIIQKAKALQTNFSFGSDAHMPYNQIETDYFLKNLSCPSQQKPFIKH